MIFRLLVVALFITNASGQTAAPDTSRIERASKGIQTLQGWFDPNTGLYKTTGWWNSANATTVLVDYSKVAKSSQYNSALAEIFVTAQNKFPGFLNKFYDDEGWWALAWIDAWDLSGNKAYLAMAESIFADMAGAWDSTCGGGIWWSKDRKYKNAIANELFLSVASHLANRDPANEASYLDWANKEWAWFAQSGMIGARNLVNDGLRIDTVHGTCSNNGQNTWTYNQGVILGGLVELAKLNPDPSLPSIAKNIASAAIASLVDKGGVLHDSCEPARCGADAPQFKGIFVRNLVALQNAYPQAAYKTFADTNADSIWDRSQGPGFQFGLVWSGPFDSGNASNQSSAIDALIAAAALSRSQ